MSTVAPPPPAHEEASEDIALASIWRLSVEQYHAMARAGILGEDDPVELLGGWLVTKMPKNPPHTLSSGLIQDALIRLLPAAWHLSREVPVTTSDSEAEPDIFVIRGDRRDYRDRNPGPEYVALVVEVANTSLMRDRGSKKRLYAEAGVQVYWLVNLIDKRIEVYTEPTGPADGPDYRRRRDFGPEEEIPVALDGRDVGRLRVSDLLP